MDEGQRHGLDSDLGGNAGGVGPHGDLLLQPEPPERSSAPARCLTSREQRLIEVHQRAFARPDTPSTADAAVLHVEPVPSRTADRPSAPASRVQSQRQQSRAASSRRSTGITSRPALLSRVLAANVPADAFDSFWHESLALTEPIPEPEPPPPPPPKPPSPPSSDLGDELSDEEDETLGAMLTAMPHVNAPGLNLSLTNDGLSTSPLGSPGTPPGAAASRPSTAPSAAAGVATATTPAVSSTLLRLARLNKQMVIPPRPGTMVSAMFEAARQGAEILDAHGALRAAQETEQPKDARPMVSMLPWNASPQVKYEAALEEKRLRAERAAEAAAAAASRKARKTAAAQQGSRPGTAPAAQPSAAVTRKTKAAAALSPRPAAAEVLSVSLHGETTTLDSSDPYSAGNPHMTMDLIQAASKAAAIAEAQLKAAEPLASAGKRGGKKAPGKAAVRPPKPGGGAAFLSHVPAVPKGTVTSVGDVAAGQLSAGPSGRSPAHPTQADTSAAVSKSAAEKQSEHLQQRMDLAVARHAAIQGAMIGVSPLRAKTARPMSALTSVRPASAGLPSTSFAATTPLLGSAVANPAATGMGVSRPSSGATSPQTHSALMAHPPAGSNGELSAAELQSVAPLAIPTSSLPSPAITDGSQLPHRASRPLTPAAHSQTDTPVLYDASASQTRALPEKLQRAQVPTDSQVLGALYNRPTSAATASRVVQPTPSQHPRHVVNRPASALAGAAIHAAMDQLHEELQALSEDVPEGGEEPLIDTIEDKQHVAADDELAEMQNYVTVTSSLQPNPEPSPQPPVDYPALWSAGLSTREAERSRLQLAKATRAARELDMLLAEEANARSSGATDSVGEAARLIRRYTQQATQGSTEVFNLTNSLRSIDQVVVLAEVLPQLPQLTGLILADNDMTDRAVQLLVSALALPSCQHVFAVDLSKNQLTVTAVKALCPLMFDPAAEAKSRPPAPVLDPVDALLGVTPPPPAPPPVSSLPAALHRSTVGEQGAVLRELLLGGNPHLGDASAELLSAVLIESSCALRVLDLGKAGLGERGAAALGRALTHTGCLEILDLSWNALGVKGSQAVAVGLKAAHCLTELYMGWTGSGDQGASYVVAALQHTNTLKVLDLSGNNVSADTCMVLQESLKVNQSLTTLILRDNPLGQIGARRLLRAVHDLGGAFSRLDLTGCTFQGNAALPGEGAIMPVPLFNPNQPDGLYCLDLELPAHLQVAFELLALARDQGLKTWKNVTLNGKPFKLRTAARHELPDKGILELKFHSVNPLLYTDTPITDQEFNFVWMSQVYPGGLPQHNPYATTARDMARYAVHRSQTGALRDSNAGASSSSTRAASAAGIANAGRSPRNSAAGRSPRNSAPSGNGAGTSPSGTSAFTRFMAGRSIPEDGTENTNRSQRGASEAESDQASEEGASSISSPTAANRRLYDALMVAQRTQSEAGASNVFDKGFGGTTGHGPNMSQVKGTTDYWKMRLLGAITSEGYLKCQQLVQVLDALHDSSTKTQAAVQCFGKLTDPENLRVVMAALDPAGAAEFKERLGDLVTFHPSNPTGSYNLLLSHPIAASVARRLLLTATQQHDLGLCRWPFHTCLVQLSIDGRQVDTEDPHKITLPREGMLKLNFVDLRPVPAHAKPMTSQQMSALVSALTNETTLKPRKVVAMVDSQGINTVVDVLARWGAATAQSSSLAQGGAAVGLSSNIAALRAAASRMGATLTVKDQKGFLPTLRALALSHYVTCDQLMELMTLISYHDNVNRAELLSIFWARTVDRADKWTDVMRKLNDQGQVMVAQRLGYCNIFNPKRPSMHYRLRMFRPDEHEIAWQLFNMAIDAPVECLTNTMIDGEPKKLNEGSSIWPVMRGSAQDGTPPTCTIEFDFTWPERDKNGLKAVAMFKEAFKAAKDAKALAGVTQAPKKPVDTPADGADRASARLITVPLRKGPTKQGDGARPGSSGGGGVRSSQQQPKMTREEKDIAEGVALTEDGKLRRIQAQGEMKFFNRIFSGQAANTAARALWEQDAAQEEVGTFGYHLSYGGGLLLDRTTSTRLKTPRALLAAGQVPGNLPGTPWDDSSMRPVPTAAIPEECEEGVADDDTAGDVQDSPSVAGSRWTAAVRSKAAASLHIDRLDTPDSDKMLITPGGTPLKEANKNAYGAVPSAAKRIQMTDSPRASLTGLLESAVALPLSIPGSTRTSLTGSLFNEAGALSPMGARRVSLPGSSSPIGGTSQLLKRMATVRRESEAGAGRGTRLGSPSIAGTVVIE